VRESNGKEEPTARIIMSIKASCLWRSLPHRRGIAPLVDTRVREKRYIYSIYFKEWWIFTEAEDSNWK